MRLSDVHIRNLTNAVEKHDGRYIGVAGLELTKAGYLAVVNGRRIVTPAGREILAHHTSGQQQTLEQERRTETRALEEAESAGPERYNMPLPTVPPETPLPVDEITVDDTWNIPVVDSNGLPIGINEALTLGAAPDGTPVVALETYHGQPEASDTTVYAYDTAEAAREDWTTLIALNHADLVYRIDVPAGALALSWGEHNRVSVAPYGDGRWSVAVLDAGRPSVSRHESREEAIRTALSAADAIADRLTEGPEALDRIGAEWLRSRIAEARGQLHRGEVTALLRQAKADRIVDRYGKVTNAQMAALMGVSTQAVGQMLAQEA